jgi:hypothetical protein
MNKTSINTPTLRPLCHQQSGSAVLAAMLILMVTMIAVGLALTSAKNRYLTSHHSICYAEAGQAAEAGAEIAFNIAQSGAWTANGFSAAPGAPGAAPVTLNVTGLESGVPGTGAISASVSADTVSMGGANWLRIRSKGIANMFGSIHTTGAFTDIDTMDVILRKLSLLQDRFTGAALTTPQATRTVEVLAKPNSLFTMAMVLNLSLNMSGGGIIDSFDSSNPLYSTNGLYDSTKRQSNAKIGLNNATGSNLNNTFVYGSIAYSGTAPVNAGNVAGGMTTPFNMTTPAVTDPTWTTYSATPTSINGSANLTAGTASSPAYYKMSSVNVPGGGIVTINGTSGQQTYIEIWVTGDFQTSGSGYILQQTGVHTIWHIDGSVNISGSSINNQSGQAANCLLDLTNGSSQQVQVSGSGNLIACINAPAANFNISGSANLIGAFIGKTMQISGGASVHYDQALANGGASGGGYIFAGEDEAVR